ncbi:PD-(D/E)XK nuclease family protein [Sulfurovum sp.]|uniref:PD-(D/E)XK nuclease family protein n=1 Tax=Sulfurovum sp. TaxID=1969726 RepID=UPI0025D9873A|nr:PD-(D/E)XK nuclease family protein [Sulfurovum sp.]
MNKLHIYPTSRALRTVSQSQKEQDGFLPALMRMDEFEQRATLIENKIQIDPIQRILLLREAASFEAFDKLNVNHELVRFFTKSDALFKFFEELAAEDIDFRTLSQADAYAEFESHLAILEKLLHNYRKLLDKKNFTDKAFIPDSYFLNEGFIQSYQTIEVHLEGYLSRFELELLEKISQQTQLIVHYATSKFNKKMQERFEAYGLRLPNDCYVSFDLTKKEIIAQAKNTQQIKASVLSVEERDEQIAVALAKIEEMVQSGINPENIALILPDEKFKEHFMLFDSHANLNFAMGYDYSKKRIYKTLEAIYVYWQSYDEKDRSTLDRYGVAFDVLEKISASKIVDVTAFFEYLESLGLLETGSNEQVHEAYIHFLKIFEMQKLSLKEWLFLWLKGLSKITIDDIGGGLITVMGVLETRGVSFEGVVIVDFNEGVVPSASSKDQFLNSSVRSFADLPTKNDREALQKQYYKRLLEQASEAVILYSTSENKLPSKFLYELGLNKARQTKAHFDLLYAQPSQLIDTFEPVVENFDAASIVWSASRLKTYLECKRKYYYRYIQKIEASKEDELIEGLFLHKVLEHLFKEKSFYSSEEEMQKILDMLLDKLHPDSGAKAEYQKLLWKEKLKGFVERQTEHFSADWRVAETEKEFQGEIGGLRFKGRIDRIDQNATETLVLDYKSGSVKEANKTKNLENLTDFQMSIYHHILSSKYQNITLAFVKILQNGEMEEITALEEKNALLEEHIIELKQTKRFAARKCEDLQKCKYCEFALMCERGEYL